jgi:hypothetical protein
MSGSISTRKCSPPNNRRDGRGAGRAGAVPTDARSRLDSDAVKEFRARSPSVHMALPIWEHYAPVLVAAGRSRDTRSLVCYSPA